MKYKLAMVLGAGSSLSMGYPTGAELRRLILEELPTELLCDSGEFTEYDLEHFVKHFRASQMFSIDAFLARRKEFSDIGKRAIASILLSRENPDFLNSEKSKDIWQQYFFNHIATHSWDEMDLKEVAIISFNYDRSFEHYMMNAMQHSYGVSKSQAYARLTEMQIIHIYGSLGTCNPSAKEYFPYENDNVTTHNLVLSAENLKVIPEGRDDDVALCTARKILSTSENIAFLGFGFDKTNLTRIRSTETCPQTISIDGISKNRRVVATTYGLTTAEATIAARATYDPDADKHAVLMESDFKDTNCIQLLRETLILDQLSI